MKIRRAKLSDGHHGPFKVAFAVGLGCALNPLNSTMIAVSFSDIALAFDRSFADTSWLVTLYLAFTAALQPLAGAVGDRVGRRRIYMAGLVFFALSSLGAAYAPDFEMLVLFRCLQAASSAFAIPNGLSLLREGVPEAARGRAMGAIGAIIGIGAAIGLPLGGWIVAHWEWRGIFWINIPIAAVALAVAWAWLPSSKPSSAQISPLSTIGVAVLPFAIGLELIRLPGSHSVGALLLTTSAVLAGFTGIYLGRSSRGRAEIALLSTPPYLATLVIIFFQNFMLYTSLIILPSWLTTSLALPVGRAGMYLGVMTFLMVVCSPLSGRLTDKVGIRFPAILGSLLLPMALAILGWPSSILSPTRVLLGLILFGVGLGVAGPSVQRAALEESPSEAGALGMGLFITARYLGGIVGAATMATGLAHSTTIDFAHGHSILQKLLLIGAPPAFVASLFLPSRRRLRS